MKKQKSEVLYLNVAVQRTPEETGGFSKAAYRKRGVALAITWDKDSGFRFFDAKQVRKLVALLHSAKLVVGYNVLAFDYEVIRGHVPFRPPKTRDLHAIIRDVVGHNVPLSAVIEGTFGIHSMMKGNQATKLWNAGKLEKVKTGMKRNLNLLRRLDEHISRNSDFGCRETQWMQIFTGKDRELNEAQKLRDQKATAHMLDKEEQTFSSSGKLPKGVTVRNPGTGTASAIPSEDCENGMQQVIRKIR